MLDDGKFIKFAKSKKSSKEPLGPIGQGKPSSFVLPASSGSKPEEFCSSGFEQALPIYNNVWDSMDWAGNCMCTGHCSVCVAERGGGGGGIRDVCQKNWK